MPTSMVKSQAKKYGCSFKEGEKYWKQAKRATKKSYDEDNPKFWGTVTKIFKNKLNKHCSKSEMVYIKTFEQFKNE